MEAIVNPYAAYCAGVAARKAALEARLAAFFCDKKFSFRTLEMGSGHGDFLVSYAGQHPERLCVGIDLITKRVEKSVRKAERAQLANCWFFKARAEEFLECQPADWRWHEVLVFYPDPWPKKRHHKHRLLQSAFFAQLAQCVVPGATLHFETDDADYFEAVLQTVEQQPDWQRLEQPTYTVDTFFSRATGQRGLRAVFQYRPEIAADEGVL